jgi:hypothetical protein
MPAGRLSITLTDPLRDSAVRFGGPVCSRCWLVLLTCQQQWGICTGTPLEQMCPSAAGKGGQITAAVAWAVEGAVGVVKSVYFPTGPCCTCGVDLCSHVDCHERHDQTVVEVVAGHEM